MFHIVTTIKKTKTTTRKSGRRLAEGRSDEGPPQGGYDLGGISDDDSCDVPQVVTPQRVKYTRLQDVLQKMIDCFSAIPLHVSALDSLAVLVYASQKLDKNSYDSNEILSTFNMLVNELDANPTTIPELQSTANVVEKFETLCKTWRSNVQYLLEFFNNNMVQIEQMCNRTFFQEVQSKVKATDMFLRQDPTQELMPVGMENTLNAVTKGPYDKLLDDLVFQIKDGLENVDDIVQIKNNVCDLYKKFIEKLKVGLCTNTIKKKDGKWYKASEFQIDFEHQFNKVKDGLGTELRNEFNKETRSNMIKELEKLMRDIFES